MAFDKGIRSESCFEKLVLEEDVFVYLEDDGILIFRAY
jgi:hypothetical protein